MKKKILLMFFLLTLIGCSNITSNDVGQSESGEKQGTDSSEYLASLVKIGEIKVDSEVVDIVEDENTKCRYIYEYRVGQIFSLTPYYTEHGNVGGCKFNAPM